MTNLKFRDNPLPTDEGAIRDMLSASGLFRPSEIDVAVELLQDRIAKGDKSEYRFLFADLDGRLQGYACYGPITVTDGRYDVYWIVVRPGSRGMGAGSMILKEAEKRMLSEGAGMVFIETSSRPDYESARKFYLKNGYAEICRVPDFYADGDARVVLGKRL